MSRLRRAERNELKWVGLIERMGEDRMVNRVYTASVRGIGRREATQKMKR